MIKLTKKALNAMTNEEVQAKYQEIQDLLAGDVTEDDINRLNGFAGMVEVEMHKRGIQPSIVVEADGSVTETIVVGPSEEVINEIPDKIKDTMPDEHDDRELTPIVELTADTIADWTVVELKEALESCRRLAEAMPDDEYINANIQLLEDTLFEKEPNKVVVRSEVEQKLHDDLQVLVRDVIYNDETSANYKWCQLLKLAKDRADESKLEIAECSDVELMRRLKLVWSKKAVAKKAGDNNAYTEAEQEEELIKSFRTAKRNSSTGGATAAEVTKEQLSVMKEEDIRKYIRNCQSKKCMAKKLKETDKENYWQAKVDEARGYLPGSKPNTEVAATLSNTINDVLTALRAIEPTTPEIQAKIAQLEALR